MIALSRFTSFLLFIFSLSLLTCALPAPAASENRALTRREPGNQVLSLVADLTLRVNEHTAALSQYDNPRNMLPD